MGEFFKEEKKEEDKEESGLIKDIPRLLDESEYLYKRLNMFLEEARTTMFPYKLEIFRGTKTYDSLINLIRIWMKEHSEYERMGIGILTNKLLTAIEKLESHETRYHVLMEGRTDMVDGRTVKREKGFLDAYEVLIESALNFLSGYEEKFKSIEDERNKLAEELADTRKENLELRNELKLGVKEYTGEMKRDIESLKLKQRRLSGPRPSPDYVPEYRDKKKEMEIEIEEKVYYPKTIDELKEWEGKMPMKELTEMHDWFKVRYADYLKMVSIGDTQKIPLMKGKIYSPYRDDLTRGIIRAWFHMAEERRLTEVDT